ncbi:MAG: fibronectin type III domain-containing protein [Bacteroidota bacterium]
MKSRLLLFCLFVFSFVNAQVATFSAPSSYNITATSATISFQVTSSTTTTLYSQLATGNAGNVALAPLSGAGGNAAGTWVSPKNLTGLTPNTTYYFRYRCDNASGTSYSTTGTFTTLNAAPTITFTNSPGSYNTVTVNYSLNANGLATTSLVRYGLTSGNLSNQVAGSSTSGTSPISAFANLSGLSANTTYYFQIEATNSVGTSTSSILSFTTDTQVPGMYSVTVSSITTNSASINYSVWDKNLATTTVVKYGLSSASLINQITGFSVSGDTTISGNVSLTGLNPSTTYFYQVEAINSAGTTLSIIGSFTTFSVPGLIAEYTFDNTYNNINGNTPFASIPGTTSFVLARNGSSVGAIQVVGNGNNGTFCNAIAPTGASPRTISFWYKTPNHTSHSLFSYGTAAQYKTFGAYFGASGNIILQGYAYDHPFSNANNFINTWRHLVLTFDGTNAKLYMDGVFIQSISTPLLNTGTGSNFRIGNTGLTMQFDDLKIFNYALSQADITSLYANNTLSSSDFAQNNLKVALYPNPVNDVLNIESETEIKSVEVYSLQGQKIKTTLSIEVNISDLASGIYMVRIEDTNNAVETKRIVKK